MFHNNGSHVVTCDGIIIWDGVTRPETDTHDGQPSYSLKIAIPSTAAEKLELEQLATNCLNTSEFKGQLPMGGNWPVIPIDLNKFTEAADQQRLTGMTTINAKSKFVPQVFDGNGQVLQAMQYGPMLYPGAVVRLMVHAYAFNNKSKGIAYALDGVQIIDGTAPKLSVGGGITTAQLRSAFGGVGAAPVAGAAPQPHAAAVTPVPSFVDGPAPERKFTHPNGQVFTESQLKAAGWNDAQIASLQPAV